MYGKMKVMSNQIQVIMKLREVNLKVEADLIKE